MLFDYAKSVLAPPEVLTRETFLDLIHSQGLRDKMLRIHNALGSKDEYNRAKRSLPVVMWQAHFTDGKRHDASARPSGLYMLDIDHITLVRQEEIRNTATAAGLEALGIYIIHRTPSEQGLRFVASVGKVEGFGDAPTIAQCQAWLAAKLQLQEGEIDTACKDMARCSFLPASQYFLYLDQKLFLDEPTGLPSVEKTPVSTVGQQAGEADLPSLDAQVEGLQEKYKGVALTEIARKYFDETGGMPVEGERHQRYLDCARVLRYICDFKPSVLYKALQPLGYDDKKDLMKVCQDACDKMHQGSTQPAILQRIMNALTEEAPAPEEEEPAFEPPALPKVLPPVFREYVRIAPKDFKPASFIALLPVLGTVFTHLRAYYLDGKQKSPSFMAVIEAPQASGKSFLEAIVEQMLHSVKINDEVSWGIWRKYMQDRKAAKNADKQPEEPDCPIRLIPATISLTMYLMRQTKASHRHLFSFIPEIATLTRTNSAGAWSQKSELYRLAFDNAEFGQDYASDNSFSGVVRVFYNWLASGTPMDVKKFFRNSEDGLVSRVVFCKLPDQLGAKLPVWQKLTAKELAELQRLVKVTGEEKTLEYNLSYVNEALEQWQEEKRQLVLRSGDRALDIFRRRSAQIGFEAAMLFHHLYMLTSKAKTPVVTKAQQHVVVACAKWVADWTLTAQYEKFAEEINEAQKSLSQSKTCLRARDLFAELPEIFSSYDVKALQIQYGSKSATKILLSNWQQNKMCKLTDKVKRLYKKL